MLWVPACEHGRSRLSLGIELLRGIRRPAETLTVLLFFVELVKYGYA